MSTGDEPEVKAEVSSQQVRRQAIFALPTLEVDGNLVTDSGVPIRYIATIANPVPGVKGLYRHIYAVYGGEALKLVNSIDVQGEGKSVKNPNNKPLLMAILATLKEANNDGIVIRCNCPASVLEAIKKKNKKATKRSKFSEEIEDIHVKMSSMTVEFQSVLGKKDTGMRRAWKLALSIAIRDKKNKKSKKKKSKKNVMHVGIQT